MLNAQLITNTPGEIPLAPRMFNQAMIKEQKIKSILVVIVDKPDGSVIIDKGETQGYEFDTLGRMTRYYYTLLYGTEQKEVDYPAIERKGKTIRAAGTRLITKYLNDTVFVNLLYDSLSRIKCKRVQAADYYDAFYFEYNNKNQIIKQTHCRETNVSENKKEFVLGVQSVLSVETFGYEQLTPTQLKKTNYNDENRAYKKTIINYSTDGRILTENTEYMIGWMNREQNFMYDDKGRISERKFRSNENGEVSTKSVFSYDGKGNIEVEKKYKNEILVEEENYLFDSKTNIVKSEAIRNFAKESVIIVKYGYSYY